MPDWVTSQHVTATSGGRAMDSLPEFVACAADQQITRNAEDGMAIDISQ